MNDPKIFLGIPTFNHAKFLPSLFESLLAQDYTNIHIEISNDGSTDNTDEVCRQYLEKLGKKFPTVIHTTHLFNLGLEGRNNFKYLSSQIPKDCELVGIIESDDFIKDPKRFSKQVEVLKDPNVGAVHSDVMALYKDGSAVDAFWKRFRIQQTGNDPTIPTGRITEHLMKCNFIYTCSLLVRKNLYLEAFDYDFFTSQGIFLGDYAGAIRLSRLTNIEYIDEPLAVYRVLDTSSSHKNRAKVISDTVKIQQMAKNNEL